MTTIRIEDLQRALASRERITAIHYACENFYSITDRPVRIICLVRHDLGTHASTAYTSYGQDGDNQAEIDMLQAFYDGLKANSDSRLVHWKMSTASFGFAAIAARFSSLTHKPPPHKPSENRLLDLASIIEDEYGPDYAPHPRLQSLAVLNKLPMRDFLLGKEEPDKLETGDVNAIQRSTAVKARIIAQLFVLLCEGRLQTTNSAGRIDFSNSQLDAVRLIQTLAVRFLDVQRALKRRHGNRNTLVVKDEYDAQDLFRSLLTIFVDDIRQEEWTPSYAGASSRIDFVLPRQRLAIELKHARSSLTKRKLGEELIADKVKYQVHPDVSHLVCVVFDPEGFIENPRGIETDLNQEASGQGMAVSVQIIDH